ncbi:MAG: FtsW/RodA/SpoVE family cell cycle protein [Planctomycetes bacterium]|nr:FtsW/RodA/SpoVE family cell cycle protein [Planctomycetota bacterium]
MPGVIRAGHGLILLVVALLTFGVVMVNSAGLTIDPERQIDLRDVLLGRPTILAGLAVAMMLVGSRVPLDRLYRARGIASPLPWLALAIVALLLAVHLPGIGLEINGARRWINLGPISFQPSEVAKWGVLLILAGYAARRASEMGQFMRGFVQPMAFVALLCALIATEDLGTAVLIGAASVGVLLAGGAKVLHAAVLAPPAVLAFVAAVLSNPYRLDRLRAFVDPYQDPQGIGYHMIQSMATVAGGGVPGRGLGNSVQKFGYLPQDTNDFIFAIICEELGLIGAAVIICLFCTLLLCGLSIIRRVEPASGGANRLLGLGILLTIGLQAVINMAVVTGLAPTKGIALPLVSAGGTGWVLTAFSIGLLVSMDRAIASSKPRPAFWGRQPVPCSIDAASRGAVNLRQASL